MRENQKQVALLCVREIAISLALAVLVSTISPRLSLIGAFCDILVILGGGEMMRGLLPKGMVRMFAALLALDAAALLAIAVLPSYPGDLARCLGFCGVVFVCAVGYTLYSRHSRSDGQVSEADVK